MPIQVDHEERRERVIDIASHILARSGLGAVTVRDVAKAAGVSTAIVSHYFKDKDELLLLTFKRNIAQAEENAEQALAATGGDLKAFLGPAMPLDQDRVDRWRIWLAYLAQLSSHPEIAAIQRDSAAKRIARLETILGDLDARGRLCPGLDVRATAERLLAVIMGLAIEVLFDLDGWPAARQHALVDAELASILLAA